VIPAGETGVKYINLVGLNIKEEYKTRRGRRSRR
jgi:hypothetical protein